jgi:hypothetical protein
VPGYAESPRVDNRLARAERAGVQSDDPTSPDAADGRPPLPRWLPLVLAAVLLSVLLMGPPIIRALTAGDHAAPVPATIPPGDDPG